MFLGIVVFLFLLAIFDLVVGVSNDAVNFMNSAIGAKAASFKTIIAIAAFGIFIGATLSNGMMEIARHGIFRPEQFYFQELMCIFLAVMVTDVVLLDIFNSLGMPTSTTVSMVFELLGGTFVLALIKIAGDETGMLGFADLLNTEKALSVILGIFLSVAVAFFFGTLVQYLSRLLFTFNYTKKLKYTIGLFGGIAVTAIIYFMLIKGLKDSAFMTTENKHWIQENTLMLVSCSFVFFTILMQILHWCKINVFKVVVMLGTFALAMAFAGNDLVNFIGVPLAGFSAYTDFMANGNGEPMGYLMNSLNGPAKTPFLFLFLAGVIMVYALITSKKAQNVVKTSVDLSRQDEGDEMFGSSAVARSIVRSTMSASESIAKILPDNLKRWADSRFNKDVMIMENGAAFDLIRASVNLVLAGLLIALGTSLKLPLSTTYVTFMVAMGSSLADRAWSRDSAVYRITGVLSVIGGWFITAGAAFTICFEHEGVFTAADRGFQRFFKAGEPKWDLKTDWQIISEIATRMGYPMHYNNTQEIWDELRHLCPDFYGATYEKMGELGFIQWPCRDTSDADQGTSYLFKEKFDTPNGLAQFFTCDWVAPIDKLTDEYPMVGESLFIFFSCRY